MKARKTYPSQTRASPDLSSINPRPAGPVLARLEGMNRMNLIIIVVQYQTEDF
jgi:hypothetical protein